MRIGLIDVDGHNFPNLALMRIIAYHKSKGDTVEWRWSGSIHYDIVYIKDRHYDPYLMIYDKPHAAKVLIDMQRWCNNKIIFKSCKRFEEYVA